MTFLTWLWQTIWGPVFSAAFLRPNGDVVRTLGVRLKLDPDGVVRNTGDIVCWIPDAGELPDRVMVRPWHGGEVMAIPEFKWGGKTYAVAGDCVTVTKGQLQLRLRT